MVTWQFDLVDADELTGQRFWHNTVLVDTSLWNYRRALDALGVKVRDETMKIKLSKLVGREVGLEIIDGEYGGTIRSEINDVFSADELSTDEDEEYEDEEEEEYEGDEEDEEDDEDEVDLDDDEEYEDEDEEYEEDDEDEDEEEEEDEEIDLNSMKLPELKKVAEEYSISIKPPRGKDRISAKMLRERIEASWAEEEDDDGEIDLDDEDL